MLKVLLINDVSLRGIFEFLMPRYFGRLLLVLGPSSTRFTADRIHVTTSTAQTNNKVDNTSGRQSTLIKARFRRAVNVLLDEHHKRINMQAHGPRRM
jgi:hypothetical protein